MPATVLMGNENLMYGATCRVLKNLRSLPVLLDLW